MQTHREPWTSKATPKHSFDLMEEVCVWWEEVQLESPLVESVEIVDNHLLLKKEVSQRGPPLPTPP